MFFNYVSFNYVILIIFQFCYFNCFLQVFPSNVSFFCFSSFRVLRDHKCHKQTLTCLALSSDAKFIFSGSKDSGLVMWDLKTGQKLERLPGGRKGTEGVHVGHCTTINTVAVSTDTQFLVNRFVSFSTFFISSSISFYYNSQFNFHFIMSPF